MPSLPCTHCGLPVLAARAAPGEPVFCCYGCYLASRIVGRRDSDGRQAWDVLRLGIGAFFAMDVMMVSMLLYTGGAEPSAVAFFRWILLAFATPAMLLLTYPFAQGAIRDATRRRLSLDALIALGAVAAFGTSAWHTIRGRGYVYFDVATMLPALVTVGKLLEATAKVRTGRLIRELETLLPKSALRLEAAGPREVSLGELRSGDRLRVRPGERFAIDGRILEGNTTIAEAAFTGELRPRDAGPGGEVLAGTVNGPGSVVVEAVRVGQGLLVRRIIELTQEAGRNPSTTERLVERLAGLFIPAVLILAAVAGMVWWYHAGLIRAGSVVLAVLVVACPCALGIATPLATALAVARAARAGIVIRGGDVLERLGQIDTIFFDKTGTVTLGRPSVQAIERLDSTLDENQLLGWLATLESASEHVLGRAILDLARKRGVEIGMVADVKALPGLGLRGRVTYGGTTREVLAGTLSQAPEADPSVILIDVAWEGQIHGRFHLNDLLRPNTAEAIAALKGRDVEPVLLSGDRMEATRAVADKIGITRIEAPRRPEEKIAVLHAAITAGHIVGMVGDGINDGPALAAAHVGMALGGGTDLARQAGHVVILSDRLDQIPWLIHLSRRTRRIIRQNLLWAFGYNAVALGAAAAGFLHPLLAALAMVVSGLTVLSNSLRLRNIEEKQ